MTNTVIDGGKLPGPQIGAIILGISQVPDGQNEARPLGDLRREAENCEKKKGHSLTILLHRRPTEDLRDYLRGLLQVKSKVTFCSNLTGTRVPSAGE